MVSRVIVNLKTVDRTFGRSLADLAHVFEIRKWCYENIKSGWRSYFVQQSDQVDPFHRSPYMVFEFDNNKDAMLFRLYTGK